MEASSDPEPLHGGEIHGFLNTRELDIEKLKEHALTRWFRPNEVHAILSNYHRFKIHPQPIETPPSGTVLLYDRKIVRNFRKDGHNWKKKKDGKAVQEAHEKLKVGNEERVHVYYARGEEDPHFFRRCYWLLDKDFERIVLVHYRSTAGDKQYATDEDHAQLIALQSQKLHFDPLTPQVDSHSISQHSEISVGGVLSEEINSQGINGKGKQEFTLDEINTLDWDDLLEATEDKSSTPQQAIMPAQQGVFNLSAPEQTLMDPQNPISVLESMNNDDFGLAQLNVNPTDLGLTWDRTDNQEKDDSAFDSPKMYFNITDISPNWAYSTDQTKVLVVGYFVDEYKDMYESNLFCNVGGKIVNTEIIQPGAYRISAPPNIPGNTDLYLTLDGPTPISQILPFNYLPNPNSPNPNPNSPDFPLKLRLAHLLFSTSNKLQNLSTQKPPKIVKEMNRYQAETSPLMEKYWTRLLNNQQSASTGGKPLDVSSDVLEVLLTSKLQEWIVERIAEGRRVTPLDDKGQGVIHLCAMLDYVWAVRLFALSGLSLDFRDCNGWTALHWAAFYGREKMVATLLSAGANPSLVTDPTSDSPGGATAADLAANQNLEGLAAFLAEKGLISHFKAMSLHGNLDSNPNNPNPKKMENPNFAELSEQELCLKDSLAAYRNAAEAANQIQAAFRERALKIQTKQARMENTEIDAGFIVAALKIQNAFRNYERRKAMKAAARIQSHFRTWQLRREFLNMKRHAIRIQVCERVKKLGRFRVSTHITCSCISKVRVPPLITRTFLKKAVFRGHQMRRQYKKIIWSVGIVEKAILRWRHKRRGLRGIHDADVAVMKVDSSQKINGEDGGTGDNGSTGEEDFFRISREQAEDRYKRSVVRVQALFRSYKAQQEYRRMKMTQEETSLEFEPRDNDSDN